MKLNWAERLVVNNPQRVFEQLIQIRWMKKVVPLSPGADILEVGCGRGAAACIILKEFKPSRLHAMDLDFAMIRRAHKYMSPDQREKISLFVGDATHLPYPSEVFDVVFGFGFLHHVPDWRRALGEVTRVLRPGGVYFMEELYPSLYQNFLTKHILVHPREDRFLSRDLKEALKGFGFSLKHVLEIEKIGILAACEKGPMNGN